MHVDNIFMDQLFVSNHIKLYENGCAQSPSFIVL